jgi:hypothetical protein
MPLSPTSLLIGSTILQAGGAILGGIGAKKESELNAYRMKTDMILNEVRASQMASARLEEYRQATSANIAAFSAAGRDIGSDRSVKAFLDKQREVAMTDVGRIGTQTELDRLQSQQAMATERRAGRTALATSLISAVSIGAEGAYRYQDIKT